jgi:hypothetical protein
MYTSVRPSTVAMVHAAADSTSSPTIAPYANALLNWSNVATVSLPLVILQAGMSTMRSRGMESSSTRSRSAEMCMRIVVSERMPPKYPPIASFSPERSSEPMSSRLSG